MDGVGRGAITGGVVQRCEARFLEACDALESRATVAVDTQVAACGDLGFPKVHRKRHRNVHVAGGLVSRRPSGGSRRTNNRAVGGGGIDRVVILAHLSILRLRGPRQQQQRCQGQSS